MKHDGLESTEATFLWTAAALPGATPSMVPSSKTPSSMSPPRLLAKEHTVSNTSRPGWLPQRLNSRETPPWKSGP